MGFFALITQKEFLIRKNIDCFSIKTRKKLLILKNRMIIMVSKSYQTSVVRHLTTSLQKLVHFYIYFGTNRVLFMKMSCNGILSLV